MKYVLIAVFLLGIKKQSPRQKKFGSKTKGVKLKKKKTSKKRSMDMLPVA